MFTRNWAKILPAVTAISAFAVTSAFAFGPTSTTSLTPAVCESPVGDDDAFAGFVQIAERGSHFKNQNYLALELATFDDDDDSVAYGNVVNSAFPTWNQIQFDVSDSVDGESFLEVFGLQPNGNSRVQGIDMFDLPLANTQNNPNGLFTVVATAAYLQSNFQFGKSFQAGTTFRSACLGQGTDGNTIFVQNVSVNNGPVANNILVTAAQNCVNVD